MINNYNTSISSASTGPRGYNIPEKKFLYIDDIYIYHQIDDIYRNSQNRVYIHSYVPLEIKVWVENLAKAHNTTVSQLIFSILHSIKVALERSPQQQQQSPTSLISELKTQKYREDFKSIIESLIKTLIKIRDGSCNRLWLKEWFSTWQKRLITAVEKLPLNEKEESLVKVMVEVANTAKDLNPESPEAYHAAKTLLGKIRGYLDE